MTLKSYIQNKKPRQYKLGHIEITIVNPHPDAVDTRSAITKSLSKIPRHLLKNINSIKVGNFEQLNSRSIQALYDKQTIVLSNKHTTTDDIVDDIIHEVAHSVEEIYGQKIYSDGKIEKEFLLKRKTLWQKLKQAGFEKPLDLFLNVSYTKELDHFLYMIVGYGVIRSLSLDLFYSPYAATSLREYFANAFEAFFMKEDISRIKSVSPRVYEKLETLMR